METAKKHSRLSTEAMRTLAAGASGETTIISLSDETIRFTATGRKRMEQVLNETGGAMVYSDYTGHCLIDYQEGALRDDFDFGHCVMVNNSMLRKAVEGMVGDYEAAGWYDLRLRLSRLGRIIHIPEALYEVAPHAGCNKPESGPGSEEQFAYVDPRNRESQIEMEKAVTDHLGSIGALVNADSYPPIDFASESFDTEVSVVIPVRNRRLTIADAVRSALAQQAGFRFNVIVVDNRSDDGTSGILAEIASREPRLHVIDLKNMDGPAPGIGGCWNIAVNSEHCGRFAVQLDSDDVYSRPDTLELIVRKFYEERCAMVVGSYMLTDFDGNPLPPGLIDHKEWTDQNGANNALRINGLGAPRAFFTPIARKISFPDVSYGEDYAMGLAVSRHFRISRIYEPLYSCRRWEGNSDHALSEERINRNNSYKDRVRTIELLARIEMNKTSGKA